MKYLTLVCLLCALGCAAISAAETNGHVASIQVVRTWQDLLNKPALPADTGTARLGIEATSAPCMSGILLYCLTEGYSLPKQWKELDRLGPFRVDVKHENDKEEIAGAGDMGWSEPPDISRSTALFRQSIPLDRPGKFQVRILSLNDELVAETEITATREKCHPWMPLEPTSFSTEDRGKYDAVACVRNREKGIAIPCFNGMAPFLFRSDGSETKMRKSAEEHLPTLLPEVAGDVLTVKASGTDLIVESKTNIILARPDRHFLVRWWVNDKPYIPTQIDRLPGDANGAIWMGKSLLLHLDFAPQRIAANPGDTVELQLLYCKDGWEWVLYGMQLGNAHGNFGGPELLLSNRTRIDWEKDGNRQKGIPANAEKPRQ